MLKEFTPKSFTILKEDYSLNSFGKDAIAGIIVGIMALPLAIAFAIASGVSPEKGLITAIVAGFLISLLGGSRVQIGGPTGAFVVIVYGIVKQHGVSGLTIATLIAGFILVAMGLLRAGQLLRYFPYTLVVGFTAGIAVIIFSSQIKDILGLPLEDLPADFIEKIAVLSKNLHSINIYAAGIATATVLITVLANRYSKKIPGTLLAIIVVTSLAAIFEFPVETIRSRFGSIPATFPAPEFEGISLATIRALIAPAFAIALLGGIESLLCAVVADGMIGGRHRPNMELVAQGLANIASALFGGIPATGAIARTAVNVKNGGRTPVAGMLHAAVLLAIMLFLASWAELIPMACLGGILAIVSYNMCEWSAIRSIFRTTKSDLSVFLVTLIITVVFDLVLAIEIGMVLAAFLFIRRMSDVTEASPLENMNGYTGNGESDIFEKELEALPENVVLYEINGPLFFGAAQRFYDSLRQADISGKTLILRMRNVPMIDATGLYRLSDIIEHLKKRHAFVLISGAREKVKEQIIRQSLLDEGSFHNDIKTALASAAQKV